MGVESPAVHHHDSVLKTGGFAAQIRAVGALNEVASLDCGQLRALAKASTDMGPSFNKGRSSVSVKPACY